MEMFQSFTEGELKQVIGTLVERKARRDAQQSKRTKRAKKRAKPCSLREVEVTVSQLGLGYVSDETIVFHYCSGKCTTSRKNYDLTLAFMKRSRLLTKDQKDKARHSPCCRPTAYEEDISFLDNFNRYHTIREFSAQACGCVWLWGSKLIWVLKTFGNHQMFESIKTNLNEKYRPLILRRTSWAKSIRERKSCIAFMENTWLTDSPQKLLPVLMKRNRKRIIQTVIIPMLSHC